MKSVRFLLGVLVAVTMLASSSAQAACSVEDMVALAKAGYVKAEIEAKCGEPAKAEPPKPTPHPISTAPQAGNPYENLEPVRITDGGEAMSTYTLDSSIIELDEAAPHDVDRVIALAHERSWPADIVDFDQRQALKKRLGRHPLTGLVGYLVGVVENDKGLVLVPKTENGDAPFNVDGDFYVVISGQGVDAR